MNLLMSRDDTGVVTGGFNLPHETYTIKLNAGEDANMPVSSLVKRILLNVVDGAVIFSGSSVVNPSNTFTKARQLAIQGAFEGNVSDLGIEGTLYVQATSNCIVSVSLYG